jgi:GNAT superfamily N-acetyltransferase
MTSDEDFAIRAMRPDELALAVEWAATEGWNPGYSDAECFGRVDRAGFLIGELEGKPAAIVSNVNYDEHFSFLGFYIVRPDLRGRGFGLRLWEAALAHAGSRTTGLDGVVAQQANYRKSGFVLAYRNIRFGGTVAVDRAIAALGPPPVNLAIADDARVFPATRQSLVEAWLGAQGHSACSLVRDGELAAWGVIRPCRRGFKVGPLIAGDRPSAETVFTALVAHVDGGELFLDVPEFNREAVSLAEAHGLAPVFETARMYNGPTRPIRIDRLYGVMSFELG